MTNQLGQKLLLDVSAGVGVAEVNDMDTDNALLLNGLIVLARLVIEFVQNRRERKRKRKEAKGAES